MYGVGDQNWGIVQDSLGRLFVANNDAVMMYDGKYWPTIPVLGGKTVLSISKTKNNVILVGAEGEFGYLNSKNAGKIKYVSLSVSLPEKEKEFSKIFEGRKIPRPVHWGGYRLMPTLFEFWQGRENRLHDRLLYSRQADDPWARVRLAP